VHQLGSASTSLALHPLAWLCIHWLGSASTSFAHARFVILNPSHSQRPSSHYTHFSIGIRPPLSENPLEQLPSLPLLAHMHVLLAATALPRRARWGGWRRPVEGRGAGNSPVQNEPALADGGIERDALEEVGRYSWDLAGDSPVTDAQAEGVADDKDLVPSICHWTGVGVADPDVEFEPVSGADAADHYVEVDEEGI